MNKVLNRFPLELIVWSGGLLLLYNLDFDKESISICPIHGLGFTWCPGCGIGRSIGLLMHGHIAESIAMHWLGIPALLVLLYRIFILIKEFLKQLKPIQ